jgi:transcriptional regulator with PAS, ATPase and Fis domain
MQRLKSVSAKGRLRVVQPAQKSGQTDVADLIESLERLKACAQGMALVIEADEQHKSLELEFGHDFYSSVRQFEIAIIERALELADGSQTKAAKLLKLKVTTLNSKIKRYKI